MDRHVKVLVTLLAAFAATAAQKEGLTSASLTLARVLNGSIAPAARNTEPVRIMIDRDMATYYLGHAGSTHRPVKDVAIVDVTSDEWWRLRNVVDPTLLATDEGFEPSEFSPTDLAHATELHRGLLDEIPMLGRGVVLAMYDSGIDWTHPMFQRATDGTAIALIWDRTEIATSEFPPPPGRSRGRLYDRATILQAVHGERLDITTTDRTGHGTAVAGVAHLLAPEADLVVIKGGDDRFSESGLLEALDFLDSLGLAWGRPVVLNLSFGHQRGPHDGSLLIERAIDAFVSRPGRFVVAAAGNDGGRGIHAEGSMRSRSDSVVITFAIPSGACSAAPGDGLDLEIWFSDTAGVGVTLESPSGRRRSLSGHGPIASVDDEGVVLIDRPASGRLVSVQLSDAAGVEPASGMYRLILRGGASFHAWVTRSRFGSHSAGFSPENVAVTERMTVQAPATSSGALAVGAVDLVGRTFLPAGWSSAGPRADGIDKPDVTASGAVWVEPLRRHATGTSIGAPMAAGVAALLFERKPQASAGEVRAALIHGATDGVLDAAGAVSALTGRTSFPSTSITLQRPTADELMWNRQRLAHVSRFALVTGVSQSALSVMVEGPGATFERATLTAAQTKLVDRGGAWLEAHDVLDRVIRFELSETVRRPAIAKHGAAVADLSVGAWPNPFNASTTLHVSLPSEGALQVTIHAIDGREVARLHDGPAIAGPHRLPWSTNVASGVYVARSVYRPAQLDAPGGVSTVKLVMLR